MQTCLSKNSSPSLPLFLFYFIQTGALFLGVGYSPAIRMLDKVSWNFCSKLVTLQISWLVLTDAELRAVGKALGSGWLKQLRWVAHKLHAITHTVYIKKWLVTWQLCVVII